MMEKIFIVCGQYGSGKTEFCINFALKLHKNFDIKISIADYDVINPYFRSREKAEFFRPYGIEILGNFIDNQTNTDLPALSANIHAPILRGEFLIIDLAGSRNGLKPLALSMDEFNENYEFLCVLNAFRPDTADEAGMIETLRSMEVFSGLKLSGIVHNSHLVHETTAEHVLYGQELVKRVSEKTGIPIAYTQLKESIYDEVKDKLIGEPVIFTELAMRQKWL